jgi:transposase, IS5 family
MKTDGHLGRCHLKGRTGDAANAILTAAGHNFRLVLTRLSELLLSILIALLNLHQRQPALKSAS